MPLKTWKLDIRCACADKFSLFEILNECAYSRNNGGTLYSWVWIPAEVWQNYMLPFKTLIATRAYLRRTSNKYVAFYMPIQYIKKNWMSKRLNTIIFTKCCAWYFVNCLDQQRFQLGRQRASMHRKQSCSFIVIRKCYVTKYFILYNMYRNLFNDLYNSQDQTGSAKFGSKTNV